MSTIPTTDETMISEWTDFSTQTRAGFKLPGVVVATLIKYISENTADVPSVEEVKSGEVMSKAYAEAMAEEVAGDMIAGILPAAARRAWHFATPVDEGICESIQTNTIT